MQSPLDERLAKLRESYAGKMNEKLDVLSAAVRAATSAAATAEDVDRLWTTAHKLAGTAGSYGFTQLGDVVREIEALAEPFRRMGAPPLAVQEGIILLLREAKRIASDHA